MSVDAVMHFFNDGGTMLAGHIAFSTLLALFPFIIFLSTVAGLVGQDEVARQAVTLAFTAMPPQVAAALQPPVNEVLEAPRPGLLTISLLVTLFVASSGLEALRAGLNNAYNIVVMRHFVLQRLQSIVLTLVLTVAVFLAVVAVVAGPFVWAALVWLLDVPQVWAWLFAFGRYGLSLFVLLALMLALYRFLPNTRISVAELLPGAVIAVVLWLASATLFSWYLANLGRYSVTYGSLGGIVAALFFFYISASVFILGAEINAAARRRREAPGAPPPGQLG